MSEPTQITSFSGAERPDGRDLLDWKSKYSGVGCQKGILLEATYLGILLFLVPACLLVLWLEYPKHWFGIPTDRYSVIVRFGSAWLSGTLGGTLFDVKWLYHSVARQIWHEDRRLWRVFTPHISGGLSFAIVALVASGIVRVFDGRAVESGSLVVGVSFLVGYFSDSAIAKLSEVAETLFGARRQRTPRSNDPKGAELQEMPKLGAAD